MAANSQTTFSNAFLWKKMFKFWLRFHWNVFPRVQLTILQHRFRWWLGIKQATSHYLNQWCPRLPMHICVTQPQWVNILRQKQNGHYFVDIIFKFIFMVCELMYFDQISLKFVSKGSINNRPVLVQIMAWLTCGISCLYLVGRVVRFLCPLLLTWFNFNPSMDK